MVFFYKFHIFSFTKNVVFEHIKFSMYKYLLVGIIFNGLQSNNKKCHLTIIKFCLEI